MGLRQAIKPFIPPILVSLKNRNRAAYLEYIEDGWNAASSDYNDPTPAAQQVEKYHRLVNEPLQHTARGMAESNEKTTLQYAALKAAAGRSALRVLDFGGAVGLHYHFIRQALPASADLKCDVVELPEICQAGRACNPHVTFYEDLAQVRGITHDFTVMSGVLQYFRDWQKQIALLARSDHFYLAKVPTTLEAAFTVRQNLKGLNGYLVFQVVNDAELRATLSSLGYQVAQEFVLSYPLFVKGAPSTVFYSTFLLQKSYS